MKQWLDFLPLILFLITKQKTDIYIATQVLLVSTVILYSIFWLKEKHLENGQKLTLALTIIFAGFTLLLHDDIYIRWKATALNGIFTIAFAASIFMKKTLTERLLDKVFDAPAAIWQKVNLAWIAYFTLSAVIQWYVAVYKHYEWWVEFKVYGSLVLIIVFMLLLFTSLKKYIRPELTSPSKSDTGN